MATTDFGPLDLDSPPRRSVTLARGDNLVFAPPQSGTGKVCLQWSWKQKERMKKPGTQLSCTGHSASGEQLFWTAVRKKLVRDARGHIPESATDRNAMLVRSDSIYSGPRDGNVTFSVEVNLRKLPDAVVSIGFVAKTLIAFPFEEFKDLKCELHVGDAYASKHLISEPFASIDTSFETKKNSAGDDGIDKWLNAHTEFVVCTISRVKGSDAWKVVNVMEEPYSSEPKVNCLPHVPVDCLPSGSPLAAKMAEFRSLNEQYESMSEFLVEPRPFYVFRTHGEGLDKKDLFGKSDPYFEFRRKGVEDPEDEPFYKSNVVKKTLDPVWEEGAVRKDLTERNLGEITLDRKILVDVYDWNRIGAPDYIGSTKFTFGDIDEEESVLRKDLQNPKKRGADKKAGVFVVDAVEVQERECEVWNEARSDLGDHIKKFVWVAEEGEEEQEGEGDS